MTSPEASSEVHRSRLFFGICLALIPTGASFALVSNILLPLKEEFILTNYQVGLIGGAALWGMAISLLVLGPMLEGIGLKNAARLAFAAHLSGITLMISAVLRAGDPSAFWLLMAGAATLAVGNGMIEVAGNPLVAALYPESKTVRLNWFHAFFPIGIVLGGIAGFLLANFGGMLARWPYQLAVIYLPILAYGWMVLPETFPKTENAEAGLPVREMFRYTLTHPLFLLMLAMMAITTSIELGPMRWVPAMLESGGMHGILVLVWISGWMVVLRLLASHFVERLAPTGMLLGAALLTGTGLFMLSFVQGLWTALAAATVFAWGVAFFFPTMVGVVSERMPRTGSLGIVLTAGVGLGAAGGIGVPLMGRIADRYLAESLNPQRTVQLLQAAAQRLPQYLGDALVSDGARPAYNERDVREAIDATNAALLSYRDAGTIRGDATANSLRAIVATRLAHEPVVMQAQALLLPAEAYGGQVSFRYVAPAALVLIVVFGTMYLRDRRRGGYRVVRLTTEPMTTVRSWLPALLAAGVLASTAAPVHAQAADRGTRLRVLFLGDNGHHRPYERAKETLPVLAARGVDMFYTDDPNDLDEDRLQNYHALVLYNNHANVTRPQLNALLGFVANGGGLVVLHCASASFQNSEEFIRLVGAAFKSHGTGTFRATRVQPDHPAIRGVPEFETWDETYIHTKHNPVRRTVLEIRREADHEEPWTWVRTYRAGRVFYTAWGHDQRTWSQEGFQKLLEQGIKWAAGDWALTQVLPDPVLEYMNLDMPLPTYQRPPAPWNTEDEPVTRAQVALPTEVSLQLTTLLPGFRVDPFATEPMIGNIIDFAWDARGRMWAVETQDYPNTLLPDSVPGNDRILILEDRNGDGRADTAKVFAEGLNLPTSLVFANRGIVVAQAPHMLFLQDTNGDDRADVKRILFSGWPRTDTHGTPSNLRYGFDNLVWGSVGYNGFRGTVGPSTYDRGEFGSGYFRFPADGSDLEYIARTSNNTWGVALSEDGYVFGSTANRRPSQYVHIPARYYRALGVREPILPGIEDRTDIYPVRDILQVDQFGMYTSGAAHELYTARAFPREFWNRAAFVAEPTGHVIGMFELLPRGSTYLAKNRWNLLASRDQWSAPVQVRVGPDGALWVSDFYTLVAQHNPTPKFSERGEGNAYETPNRDRLHGRIYRISWRDTPPARPMRLDDATPAQLVDALRNDNMFWRMTAQRLLVERAQLDVVPALVRMLNDHAVDELGLNAGALHALWTLHGLAAFARDNSARQALQNALHHPAASLRRAALMVLPRDASLEDAIFAAGMLPDRTSPTQVAYTVPAGILQDADAKVRLQALLTLSELPATSRGAAAIVDLLLAPENARDRWLPDAAAIAAAPHGPGFLVDLLQRRMPSEDSTFLAGVRQTVGLLARYHAARTQAATVVALISAVPASHPALAAALLDGIAEGWPEEQPPTLSAEQRATLKAAARDAAPELAPSFARVATRWGLSDVF